MAKFLVLCLVLLNAFVAMASFDAEAPTTTRKLGKHQAASPSPPQAPHGEKNIMQHPVVGSPSEGQTAAVAETSNGEIEGGAIHARKPRRSGDKSVAGGGVILGGLATTFLVAVFCYIRATRRHKSEAHHDQSDNENK